MNLKTKMKKIYELQDKLQDLQWCDGITQFNITSTGTRHNHDITVDSLTLEIDDDGNYIYVMFIDVGDKLLYTPLKIFTLDQLHNITSTKNNITLDFGTCIYNIAPVRG